MTVYMCICCEACWMKGRNQAARWECGGFKSRPRSERAKAGKSDSQNCRCHSQWRGPHALNISASISLRPDIPSRATGLSVANVAEDSATLEFGLVRTGASHCSSCAVCDAREEGSATLRVLRYVRVSTRHQRWSTAVSPIGRTKHVGPCLTSCTSKTGGELVTRCS